MKWNFPGRVVLCREAGVRADAVLLSALLSLVGLVACGDEGQIDQSAVCGDGQRQVGEVCDGADLGGLTDWTDVGYDSGDFGCDDDCAGFDVVDCQGPPVNCPNGVREAGEVCDGTDLGGLTDCTDLGYESGDLTCQSDCLGYDVSSCSMAATAVDLRPLLHDFGLFPDSQGERGTCSIFAITGLLEYAFAVDTGSGVRLSPEYLNWASNQTCDNTSDGSFYSQAVAGARVHGICTEALLPYRATYDSGLTPSEDALEDAAARSEIAVDWIKRWDVTTGLDASQLEAIKEALRGGDPVAVGMRWPNNLQFDAEEVMQVPAAGDVFDGHSVILVGFEDDASLLGGGAFIFRNHAGPTWKGDGYAMVPYEYISLYTNDAITLWVDPLEPVAANISDDEQIVQEAEALTVVDTTGTTTSVQSMTSWCSELWSGGEQVFIAGGASYSVTFEFDLYSDATYDVVVYATRAPDFGRASVSIDDFPLLAVIDGYSPRVEPTGRIPLGTMHLTTGSHSLTLHGAGRNNLSTGYHFGFDAIEMH